MVAVAVSGTLAVPTEYPGRTEGNPPPVPDIRRTGPAEYGEGTPGTPEKEVTVMARIRRSPWIVAAGAGLLAGAALVVVGAGHGRPVLVWMGATLALLLFAACRPAAEDRRRCWRRGRR
ncbi:hypothetical protein [Amycolatopsis aidingensis]|uniref:hypothetical protein n=1 Tax=Amycolatopsis aidingensis TaxID=2842453 RepID=UPI001C0E4A28|nr:hypothetical protein [Amycolatopsis aidingensis]